MTLQRYDNHLKKTNFNGKFIFQAHTETDSCAQFLSKLFAFIKFCLGVALHPMMSHKTKKKANKG